MLSQFFQIEYILCFKNVITRACNYNYWPSSSFSYTKLRASSFFDPGLQDKCKLLFQRLLGCPVSSSTVDVISSNFYNSVLLHSASSIPFPVIQPFADIFHLHILLISSLLSLTYSVFHWFCGVLSFLLFLVCISFLVCQVWSLMCICHNCSYIISLYILDFVSILRCLFFHLTSFRHPVTLLAFIMWCTPL